MRSVLTIARLSLLESLRNRLFVGMLVFLLLFLGFAIYVATLSLDAADRYLQNTGMLGISLINLAVVILFGLYSLYQEKDRKELFVLLNRVSRGAYLLGRFLGTAAVLALFSLLAGCGVLLVTWLFGDLLAPALLWAVYWALLEFTLLTAVALLFYAAGIGFTLNALLVLAVYVVGHSLVEAVRSFIGLGMFGNPYHLMMVQVLTYVLPNFEMFNFRLAIVHGDTIALSRFGLATAYWLAYVTAILAAAAAIFNRRDVQ